MRSKRKFVGILMAAVMLISLFYGAQPVKAAAYIEPTTAGSLQVLLVPGQTTHVVLPIKATYSSLYLYSIYAEAEDASLLQTSAVKIMYGEHEISATNGTTMDINPYEGYTLEFDIEAKDSITIGYYSIDIKGTGFVYDDGGIGDLSNVTLLTMTGYVATELEPVQLVVDKVSYNEGDVVADSTFDMTLTIKNEGEIKAVNAYLSVDFGSSGMVPDYSVDSIKIGTLSTSSSQKVTVPVRVLPGTEAGLKSITVNMTCKDPDGNSMTPFARTVYITVKNYTNTEENPVLELTTTENYKELTPGTSDTIKVTIVNNGKADAQDVKLAVSDGLGTSTGLTKAYTSESIEVGVVPAGKKKQVEIPLNVAKSFAAGLYELSFKCTYADASGNAKTPATMTMYINGPVDAVKDESIKNNIIINNVVQNPSQPEAGQNMTVSFDVTNDGNAAVTNFRVSGENLSATGFEPVNSEPYQNIGTIEANTTKRVTMTFKVGDKISDGLNSLDIKYDYMNANDVLQLGSVQVYILNVVNNLQKVAVIGKPKLIISDFSTDEEVLKAGGTFNFTFTLKNTHNSKAAKNIKLTLTQNEGIFAPTEGSNIFYIEELEAGQTIDQIINLKTRADATTGDYAMSILVEYEYDDMSEIDLEKGGVSEENTIKLRATENYRPVIENIFIDSWSGVRINQAVDLSFEFYNMGKSTLGNVYITVEGDFALANNSEMSYVGAVSGYGQEYITPQVVPLVEGEANGTLVVHFEDSNGDEVTISSDFTAYVEGEEIYDPGEYMEPDWGNVDVGNEDLEVKEDILPLWLFIVILVAILAIVTPVTYAIIVSSKKKKLRKQYDAED